MDTPMGMPGPTGAWDDNVSYQTNIIVCAVITWVGAAIFVAARFYTRHLLVHVWGWEDWCILLALVFSGLNNGGMIEQAVYGLGRHVWTIDPNVMFAFGRSGWLTILWYMMSLWATKISILLLYLRILVYPWAKVSTYVLIALTMLTNIWTLAATMTACVPLESFWDHSIQGVCHTQDWWWGTTGLHITIDFLIYLLPTPVIFTLKLRRRQKWLLYFIFAFGFFLCLISIIRLIYLAQGAGHLDFSWGNVSISYWTCVEINFAIICACIMTFKPLVTRIFPTVFDERRLWSDPEHGRSGRPPTIGTKATRMVQAGRASWIGRSRGDPDATIMEEEEHEISGETLTEMHEGCEEKDVPSPPAKAHVRDTEPPYNAINTTKEQHLCQGASVEYTNPHAPQTVC